MSEQEFRQIIEAYVTGGLDGQQREKFFEQLEEEENLRVLEAVLGEEWKAGFENVQGERAAGLIEQYVMGKIGEVRPAKVSFIRRYRLVAAAVLMLLIGGITWMAVRKSGPERVTAGNRLPVDIAPGKNGAILTLGNGKTIVLDSAGDGKITEAAEKKGNVVSYEGGGAATVEYNTMTTPRGRQFSLVLPDGSQVWLNASSSITYPTAFVGGERKVAITGEAYFEVAHDASRPFFVSKGATSVQVLGTHFNVNAYEDENVIRVTLLEGSVAVKHGSSQVKIKPGQQAGVTEDIKVSDNADIDQVMAWKNGYFSFKDADIKTVMRQLSRWYDIEVVFNGPVPAQKFNGEIGRGLSLKEVLEGLAFTSGHFKIEDRKKLIIIP